MLAAAAFSCSTRCQKLATMEIMRRFSKWLLLTLLLPVVLLGGVAAALQFWVGSDDFRARVSRQLSQALGVAVTLGNVTVDLWPLPAVGLQQVQVQSRPALTLDRIEARPSWAPLLQGRLEIATLLVRDAVVPQQAVGAIAAAFQKTRAAGERPGATAPDAGRIVVLPRRVLLEQVRWVPEEGGSSMLDAQARLDDDGLPASAELRVSQGRFEGAHAKLERQPDHWALRAELGGGTVAGKLQWRPAGKAPALLQGEFDTANVEVAALTAPSRTLTGRVDAHTALRAEWRPQESVADALQSQTRFTVRNAVVHGVDLARAVKTVGANRGGETQLETLAGQVVTRGRHVELNNLVASSGVLSANGHVAMAPNRSLSGRITVDLAAAVAGGTLGVPLAVGGTLDDPSVTLSRGALLGAALGTMVAPGVGTGAGAKLGDRVGEGLRGLFGK